MLYYLPWIEMFSFCFIITHTSVGLQCPTCDSIIILQQNIPHPVLYHLFIVMVQYHMIVFFSFLLGTCILFTQWYFASRFTRWNETCYTIRHSLLLYMRKNKIHVNLFLFFHMNGNSFTLNLFVLGVQELYEIYCLQELLKVSHANSHSVCNGI